MKNGFVFNDGETILTGTGQLSMGDGMDLSQRFAYDYSKRPQSIAFRKKDTAKTGSISIAFNRLEVDNIFDEIARYEAMAGKVGLLFWNGRNLGKFMIISVQFSLAVDGIDIVSACSIGLEIKEGFEKKTNRARVNRQVELM